MPVDDPILRLAIAMYHNEGAYALLVGSGVSRSAGIPTGWEIVSDLVRQLAASRGEECRLGEEEDWYTRTFGEKPTYDSLLDRVTGFKVERARLLADYIEPKDGEVADGAKVPQEAHRAIARLVRAGYIRVIVTTNFDQLLEQALRAVNIAPRIVATAEAVEQRLPLVHERCTIIKVHGDYTSREVKNTTEELLAYDERLNLLLERVFSDFGLIVCGWSAEWDHALRAVLQDSSSRAYSTFWTVKGDLKVEAQRVIQGRNGKAVIRIEDADSFFQVLEEKVASIRDLFESETLSPAVAAATLERYLSDPYGNRIRVDKLVSSEVERVLPRVRERSAEPPVNPQGEMFRKDVESLQAEAGSLIAMFAAGCRWGSVEQLETWSKALARIMNDSSGSPTYQAWGGYWSYFGALLVYSGGIAALSGQHVNTFVTLEDVPVLNRFSERVTMLDAIKDLFLTCLRKTWLLERGAPIPLSLHLYDVLRPALSSIIPDPKTFDDTFDRFEYLQALISVDMERHRTAKAVTWAPMGRFGWQYVHSTSNSVVGRINSEIDNQGATWLPLQRGLLGGDLERLTAARQQLERIITGWAWW